MKKLIAHFALAAVAFILSVNSVSAQKTLIQKADELFNNLEYSKAKVAYEDI